MRSGCLPSDSHGMPKLSAPAHFGQAPGLLPAGAEIPATYEDSLGEQHPVDLDRLHELGLVADGKEPAAAPGPENGGAGDGAPPAPPKPDESWKLADLKAAAFELGVDADALGQARSKKAVLELIEATDGEGISEA